jgi:hypothetical protein
MAAPEERLEDLEQKIDDARRRAEDDGLIPDRDPDPTWADPDADGVEHPPDNAPA